MSHDLPAAVRAAILDLTAGQANLVPGQGALSEGYRAGRTSAQTVRGAGDVAAYLLARLPATYAAVHRVLCELQEAMPEFAPRTLADVGCGPGTAALAALACFDDLVSIRGVDANPAFLDVAPRLLAASGLASGVAFEVVKADFRSYVAGPVLPDLTIAAYALVEGSESEAGAMACRLFAATAGVLVLVEPGSRAGFARILAARTALVAAGAQIVGPCTHAGACPMADPDWCHFAVRLARSREHRRIKQGDAPFEDEKFSYLIAGRAERPASGAARIIAPAYHGKGGSQFRVCSAAGLEAKTLRARDVAHKTRRKLDWGDLFPLSDVSGRSEPV